MLWLLSFDHEKSSTEYNAIVTITIRINVFKLTYKVLYVLIVAGMVFV